MCDLKNLMQAKTRSQKLCARQLPVVNLLPTLVVTTNCCVSLTLLNLLLNCWQVIVSRVY